MKKKIINFWCRKIWNLATVQIVLQENIVLQPSERCIVRLYCKEG